MTNMNGFVAVHLESIRKYTMQCVCTTFDRVHGLAVGPKRYMCSAPSVCCQWSFFSFSLFDVLIFCPAVEQVFKSRDWALGLGEVSAVESRLFSPLGLGRSIVVNPKRAACRDLLS